jgi:hypothetical protein
MDNHRWNIASSDDHSNDDYTHIIIYHERVEDKERYLINEED